MVRILYGRDLRPGEKGGGAIGKTKRGKGTKLMVVADGTGLPVGDRLYAASPHEATLAEATLQQVSVPQAAGGKLLRLIADRAYDSDPLRKRLAEMGIELIIASQEAREDRDSVEGLRL